ncbi:Nuclear protein localization protein 4 [Ceratocystis fimbriata CBS 114723]|uniref:Nuclear protein localization protein 4 n=1 Tax=Ceratocystis fimbriata CBS 114723 TaxID=1035309 RepID=A0A2C5XHR0_9PEZI|nr:Nuclear protein localization protein 4 [Ceratocystis fimbriata CBS 114723]
MLLRVRGPDGMIRVNVEPEATFGDFGGLLVPQLPDTVDPYTIALSNSPTGTDSKLLEELSTISISRVGMKHGDLIFISYKHKGAASAPSSDNLANSADSGSVTARLNGKAIVQETPSAQETIAMVEGAARPWELIKQSPLDDKLDKLPGTIPRSRNSMCKHGPKGMCDYCTPLEPFNPTYLSENGIKYPSFHAHLRKINAATNKPESGTSFIPPLSEPFYRVAPNCSGGHPKWPIGICSKCQPSAIILQPQNFRMVDHVEFASPSIINTFIDAWRRTGLQRIGILYGRYAEYAKVPLGIKAVVEAVYEIPQVDEVDGLTTNDWTNESNVDNVAKMCGLEKVGVIWTDLLDAGKGDGSVVCKRHAESYFLSSQEICFASRLQAKHPRVTKWSRQGVFGSNFVTCVISGNENGEIEISSYQMSNSAVEMVRANIIEPSTEPAVMFVQEEEEEETAIRSRYIPEVFYRKINEYGANVQENAKPSFPVEYLFVTLTHGFPEAPKPVFLSSGFPVENRSHVGISQDHTDLAKALKITHASAKPVDVQDVSDFHLLCFIKDLDILSEDELSTLCKAAVGHNQSVMYDASATSGWRTLQAILQSTGERIPKRQRASSAHRHDRPYYSQSSSRPSDLASSSSSSDAPTPLSSHSSSTTSASASHDSLAPSSSLFAAPEDQQPLAKRFAAVRLNNENRPRRSNPPRPE